ncbi:MAG: FAD-binding protein [Thermoguttaceae bacterium]|nr:FAD-binding protein [Thermoguttaceae bacterium]
MKILPVRKIHTIVLGSGAAGLAAAVRLRAEGVPDIAILTEGLRLGTSVNAGSDKQTYYKLGICGREADSPLDLALTYLRGGSADPLIALTEAAGSVRAFFHLVNLGVPFPHNRFGEYVGYKTDHDPFRRATSCGPYTSREMCRALLRRVKKEEIPILENRSAVKLATYAAADGTRRLCGLLALNTADGVLEPYCCENLVFAVGGPGGLYEASVYPSSQFGAIGLALEIGAAAASLPESQFGLASVTDISKREFRSDPICDRPESFRWNVSGTYMQVLPRFVSTEPDGVSGVREFLRDYRAALGEINSLVFLKGYQWPFDARKLPDGSSMVDMAVFYETAVLGRRVFLDYRTDPADFSFEALDSEAREYLRKSDALLATPLARLAKMNPGAVELYRDHGIDLAAEPLEIALCAQHNNGGLKGTIWYESENVPHLFPIGEVNGSHGVTRPGGSALNAGQVGAFRAAQYIARRYSGWSLDWTAAEKELAAEASRLAEYPERAASQTGDDWRKERAAFQCRMTRSAGHLRHGGEIGEALRLLTGRRRAARPLSAPPAEIPTADIPPADAAEIFRNRQLLIAQEAYLSALSASLDAGSRGSALVLDPRGEPIHPRFPGSWRIKPEDPRFRDRILITRYSDESDSFLSCWRPLPDLPEDEEWFENVWRDYRSGTVFD